MPKPARTLLLLSALELLCPVAVRADESLHARIDALIAAKAKPLSPVADDAEFLRRVTLDLAGRIPSLPETRAFLQDTTSDKRAKVIDQLLAGPDHPRHMAELFHVMLMERQGDHPEWSKYLRASFEASKPWDQMTREILRAAPLDEATRGSAFFFTKRLEHVGENPIDYPGLTRDVGRLFLGRDFRCCQCHDHVYIDEYKQENFQGLHAYFINTYLQDAAYPTVGEKPTTKKLTFASVFKKIEKETYPRLPGGKEMDIPSLKKGEEYVKPADPKTKNPGLLRHSPLAALAEELPTAANHAFVRNSVNRLWFVMMGRGLVHPLDQFHAGNPPSHPELLDLLAQEFVVNKFDMRWLLRELALSQTYQRSSLCPPGSTTAPAPELFATALEKRVSAEQMMWSMLEATGTRERVEKGKGGLDPLRLKFVKAFANPPREPEEEISPALKSALFVLNDETILSWLAPQGGDLVERLAKLTDEQVAEELYLSVLTRMPTADEKAGLLRYLAKHAERRPEALGRLAWSLLASTEFGVNH